MFKEESYDASYNHDDDESQLVLTKMSTRNQFKRSRILQGLIIAVGVLLLLCCVLIILLSVEKTKVSTHEGGQLRGTQNPIKLVASESVATEPSELTSSPRISTTPTELTASPSDSTNPSMTTPTQSPSNSSQPGRGSSRLLTVVSRSNHVIY